MTDENQLAGYDEPSASAPPPTGGQLPPSAPDTRTLLGLAVTAIVVAALYLAQDVLVPITLAVMLSFVLSPLTNLLRWIGLWRDPAVALSILVALAVIGPLGTLIGRQAAGLTADAPRYAEAIEQKIDGTQALATAHLGDLLRSFGSPGETPTAHPSQPPPAALGRRARRRPPSRRPGLVELARPRTSALRSPGPSWNRFSRRSRPPSWCYRRGVHPDAEGGSARPFIRVFGSTDLHRTTLALDEAGERFSRFFISQLGINACFGLVIGLGLWVIGIPSPALWGAWPGCFASCPTSARSSASCRRSRWARPSIPAGGPRSGWRCCSW